MFCVVHAFLRSAYSPLIPEDKPLWEELFSLVRQKASIRPFFTG